MTVYFNAHSDWFKCFDEYHIKQIDSIFPFVCALIDAQKVSKCGESKKSTPFALFTLRHLEFALFDGFVSNMKASACAVNYYA